jgi:hypothetical protein
MADGTATDQGKRHGRTSDLFEGGERRHSTRNSLLAFLAVFAIIATTGAAALSSGVHDETVWSTFSLSYGSNPVTQQLGIQFARVAYIDQPTQFNTTAFVGATTTANSAFITNSSGYGIMQYNTTTGDVASENYAVAASLGSNVSYVFTDQRVALNGTGGTWTYEVSEAAQTSAAASSGNVSDGSAGAAQNTLWIESTYSSGNYTFTAADFEYKHGGYQTYTSYALGASVKVPRLQFFEVYFYVQKTSTVVSIVQTNNSAVIGSATMHPVLAGNLSSIADLTDQVTMSTSTNFAAIVSNTYLVDHNTFSGVSAGAGAARELGSGVVPFAAGTDAGAAAAPFDPAAAQKVNYTATPSSLGTYGGVNESVSAFSSFLNSSSVASQTSAKVNTSLVVNATSKASSASAAQTLSTLRAERDGSNAATATLYLSTWTPASIQSQISTFLTGYISTQTGIPANEVEIQNYLISNISVETTFSSQAGYTIHNYVASALPGFLQSSNLALVNQATGAVDAGADIGMFWDFAEHKALAPVVHMPFGSITDPTNGVTYASAEAAGFPIGSTVTAAGAISVPYQAAFLGWSASGVPEFSPGGCFVVCLGSSLSGAASAVSNFLGSAASSVSNAAQTVTNTVSNDVIQPVSGTLATDVATLTGDVSQAVSNVMPFTGGTLANVGSAVSSGIGGVTKDLSALSGTLASSASSAAGALASGVDQFTNNIWSLGSAAGSVAQSALGGAVRAGTQLINTVGGVVGGAAAVISPYFEEAGNAVINGVSSAGRSLASLGSSVATAGMSALDSVGHSISQALGGAWSAISNAFGGLGSDFLNGLNGLFGSSATSSPVTWATSLGGTVTFELIIVVVLVVVAIAIIAAFLFLRHHRRRHSGHEVGGRKEHRESRVRHRRPRKSGA